MNKILLFAHLKEELGQSELQVEVTGKTVGELREYLKDHTSIGSMESVMIAINEEFAPDHVQIQAGDIIALIPPVSGG